MSMNNFIERERKRERERDSFTGSRKNLKSWSFQQKQFVQRWHDVNNDSIALKINSKLRDRFSLL